MSNFDEQHIFYNLKVGRGDKVIGEELRAIRDVFRPVVLAGCEGNGYVLPYLKGYNIIRDRSRESRANIWAYVANNVKVRKQWHDLKETWPRTQHAGMHAPRSILELELIHENLEVEQAVVAHAPPNCPGSGPARSEWLDAMERITRAHSRFGKKKPRLLMMDANGFGDELARVLEGELHGNPVEAIVTVNLEAQDTLHHRVAHEFGPRNSEIVLGSDHPMQRVRIR